MDVIFDVYQVEPTCFSGKHKVTFLEGNKVVTKDLDDALICNLLLNLNKEIPLHFQKWINREKWEPRFDTRFYQRNSNLIVDICGISTICHCVCGSPCRHAVKVMILEEKEPCLVELGGEKITFLLVKFRRKIPDHFIGYLCCDEVLRFRREIAPYKGIKEDNLTLRYDMC